MDREGWELRRARLDQLLEELADELPDSSLAVIAGTAHVPQLERPDTIDLLIAAFLARLEQALTGDA